MPLVIMSFIGAGEAAPMADAALQTAYDAAKDIAPPGCRVEARALDRTFLDCRYSPGQPPRIIIDDMAGLPDPIAAATVSIWMDGAIDNLELRTHEIATELHAALGATGTAIFDARRHLDLVGHAPSPTLQAVAVVERRRGLDRDTFMQYYRTHHVPLAKSLKPRFTRYTTFRTLETISTFPGDCVTIQEYPSLEALRQHLYTRTADGDAAGDDIDNFIAHLTYNIGERMIE
jgi:hypothetical protein